MVVSKNFNIIVLQIEDRETDFLSSAMNSNKSICSVNGLEYMFVKKVDNYPPYWGKIAKIRDILNEIKLTDVDYVFWVDSDAFFINFSKERLFSFLDKHNNYDFICTHDMPPWNTDFNAGVFIVKNSDNGRNIISKWLSYYHPNVWKYDESLKKWSTDAEWAGVEYEQGAFSSYILKDSELSKYIVRLPYYYLNNNNCSDNLEDALVVHLAGEHKVDKVKLSVCNEKLFKNLSEGFSVSSNVSNIELLMVRIMCVIISIILLFLIVKRIDKNILKSLKY